MMAGEKEKKMDAKNLKKAFAEAKKSAGLDFSITNPDALGDCQSCVWSAIVDKYGADSRGIWCKHWHRGMNKGAPIEELGEIYIAHDLTDDQARAVLATLSKYYTITSGEFNAARCIVIKEDVKQ